MYAIVDIDLFKGINDSYGHLFGDFCLAATAKILKEFFHRDADIVTRFGGEEFVIVAPYSDVNNARLRVESMRLQVANYSFKKGAIGPVELTVSVGIAIGDARYSNAQGDWFTIADKCLYQAKNNGRNQTNIKLLSSKK
jgi:diguanylate cyclase (GGDEF)-like protein